MNYVIIGAGAAGLSAAKTIREKEADAKILLISTDKTVHSRCMLHKYISRERDEKALNFEKENFFEEYQITWKSGVSVTELLPEEKIVRLDQEDISYDKLLIATGANSIIPPVGDLRTAPNVFGMRHLSDVQNMEKYTSNKSQIVIIGSGLVGLDAAYGYLERGMKVSVIEMADHILPLQLDKVSALSYQTLFEEHGCKFYLGKKASQTICDSTGSITHLLLDDGTKLPCDLVLAAAGVRPATEFIKNSGIECDRGIQVNEFMQTNIDSIYAAGDVTGLSGIWPNARKQGVLAGKNMCGESICYTDRFCIKNTINFFGLVTLSLGKITPDPKEEVLSQESKTSYKKIIINNQVISGVLLQGDITGSGFWQYLIKNKIEITPYKEHLFHLSYGDFYGVKQNGEYEYKI